MHIIHIEEFFHPNAGYQINILAKMMASKNHKITIICGKIDSFPDELVKFFGDENIEELDKEFEQKYNIQIIRLPVKFYYSGRAFLSRTLYKLITQLSPDLLFVHGNDSLTGMRVLLNNKKIGVPIIMDSHMLEMASENKFSKLFHFIYRKTFAKIIINKNIYVIKTQNSLYVNKCLGVPAELSPWVSVGSDTLLFYPSLELRMSCRERFNIGKNEKVIMYCGKLIKSKGIDILYKALEMPFDINEKILVMIVGNKETNEFDELENAIMSNKSIKLIKVPTQAYTDLPLFYNCSDIIIYPKQCSLSFFDAQACGKPVIFENNEINIGRSLYNNAVLFKNNDYFDLHKVINDLININSSEYNIMSNNSIEYIKKNYDYSNICDIYLDYCEEQIKRYKK